MAKSNKIDKRPCAVPAKKKNKIKGKSNFNSIAK